MKLKHIIIALALLACLPFTTAQAQNPGQAREFVSLMSDYMSLVDQVVAASGNEEAAVFMAIEGIYEVYEHGKDAPGAIRHFERLLEEYGDNRTVRTMLRLKMRDIYKEIGQPDKVLEQLDLIIAENLE